MLALVTCLFLYGSMIAQGDAARRASTMGIGMNLSYLDNFWLGKREKHFSDFAKPDAAGKRRQELIDIAKARFKTVRIPICFGAWASIDRPYRWDNPQGLAMADQFVQWARDEDLNVIIDLHHTEFDGKVAGAATTERFVWLWKQLAARYAGTDPEHVFFEIRNEPHDIKPEDWRAQAEAIIAAIRSIDKRHTLIVGFHDWNSRQALIDSKPFDDPNIIYTFHYYDPFVFTHQGATWTVKGMADTHPVPFPGKPSDITIADSAKGTWVESQIMKYGEDSRAEKMFADLKAAQDWSDRNHVPIFLGEFGSFSKYPALQDRCRHASVDYAALGRLKIPNTWWEWDGGFNMFQPGTTKIAPCMRAAVTMYSQN